MKSRQFHITFYEDESQSINFYQESQKGWVSEGIKDKGDKGHATEEVWVAPLHSLHTGLLSRWFLLFIRLFLFSVQG